MPNKRNLRRARQRKSNQTMKFLRKHLAPVVDRFASVNPRTINPTILADEEDFWMIRAILSSHGEMQSKLSAIWNKIIDHHCIVSVSKFLRNPYMIYPRSVQLAPDFLTIQIECLGCQFKIQLPDHSQQHNISGRMFHALVVQLQTVAPTVYSQLSALFPRELGEIVFLYVYEANVRSYIQ